MRHYYITIALTTILFMLGKNSYAQDSIVVSSLQKDTSVSVWHQFKQTGSVNFYYQYVDCGPIEYINIKVGNTSLQPKTVSWTYEYFNNGSALSVNPDDANINFSLNPFEIKTGICFGGQNENLQIYVKEGTYSLRLDLIILSGINVSN